MSSNRRPDIVVGIDIGQTCSGVAYSIGPDWSEPRTLNKWPGAHGIERADKVATRVGYRASTHDPVNWGFETVFGDDKVDVREQFKLTLDAEYEDDRGYSCHDARQWYFDYLVCLRLEIERFFDASIPRWRDMYVEYSFSSPTTWKNPAMIASIQKLVEAAGFGGGPRTSVRMALTEAEAAAIEASTTQYRVGEVFLICDAGGGTTDVNLLKVMSTERRIALKPLDHVEGVPIGSTLIDFRMAQHLVQRLEMIEQHLDGDLYCLAEEMLMGRFQTVKHSFPNPVVDQFWLDVKGLAGTHNFPEAGITNSRMSIDRTTLTEIFDQQLRQIFSLIDERLTALQAEFPEEQVSYIILSGGLGSSPYLYEEIKRRYEMNNGFQSNNTRSIRTMRVLEPQLAVVRGLVRERTQQLGVNLNVGQEVFTTRRCRNAYGLVTRRPYDESTHRGLKFVIDAHSGRRYIPDCITWFIVQGQEIAADGGIREHYKCTMAEGQQYAVRHARIVMSSLPPRQLPIQLTQYGWKDVVIVKFKLAEKDMKLKNRQPWKMAKKYWQAEFDFLVRLGPADLRFQIIGQNGLLSSDQDSLEVEFMDPSDNVTYAAVPNGVTYG